MSKGQSLFEVVMALSVISIIIFGIVVLAITSIANSNYSRNKALAANYSQEALEWLRGQRDSSWSAFLANSNQTWCITSEPITGWGTSSSLGCGTSAYITGSTLLKREAILTTIDSTNVQAKVKVYWNDAQGYHEASSVTNFTNFKASSVFLTPGPIPTPTPTPLPTPYCGPAPVFVCANLSSQTDCNTICAGQGRSCYGNICASFTSIYSNTPDCGGSFVNAWSICDLPLSGFPSVRCKCN